MSDDLSEKVRQFVSDFAGKPLERVMLPTRLEEDLGITGDDASDLIREFSARFAVDITGLEFHKHFGPEGVGCNPLWLIWPPAGMKDYRKYPVTVDHLVRVAETKRWFSPPCVYLSRNREAGQQPPACS